MDARQAVSRMVPGRDLQAPCCYQWGISGGSEQAGEVLGLGQHLVTNQ